MYCRPLEPKGTLSYVDLEDEELEEFGVGKLEDFTWKDLLDAEACVRCGRCETVCPAHGSGKPLSPKDLMQALDAHLGERGPLVRAERRAEAAGEAFEPTEEQRAVLDKALHYVRRVHGGVPGAAGARAEGGGHAHLPGVDGKRVPVGG